MNRRHKITNVESRYKAGGKIFRFSPFNSKCRCGLNTLRKLVRLGFLLSAEESKESEAGIALDLLPLAHCRLITGGQKLFPANLRHKSLKKKVKKKFFYL